MEVDVVEGKDESRDVHGGGGDGLVEEGLVLEVDHLLSLLFVFYLFGREAKREEQRDEGYQPQGNLVELEPGGRNSFLQLPVHCAISVNGVRSKDKLQFDI